MSALAKTPSTRGLSRAMSKTFEHRPPVDHRPRLARHPDHAASRVVGGDDEHRTVGDELLAARPVGERLGNSLGRLDSHRGQGREVGVVEMDHVDSSVLQHLVDFRVGGHGVGTHQPSGDDRPGSVGVLDDSSRWPAAEQTVDERAAERVARTESTHDVDRARRHDSAVVGRWRRAHRRCRV